MGRRARSLTFSNILFSTVPVFLRTGICFPSLSSAVEICRTSVPTGDQTRVSQSSRLLQAAGFGNQTRRKRSNKSSFLHRAPSSVCCFLHACPRLTLNCHVMGFTLRQAQICPKLPNLSELARNPWRPLMCVDSEALVSTFKSFLLHFIPLALRLHAVRASPSLALGEESVGLLSRFTGVVHLTA